MPYIALCSIITNNIKEDCCIQLGQMAGLNDKVCDDIIQFMCSKSAQVEQLVSASFLNDTTKRNYWQSYQTRLKQMLKQ